MPANPKPPKPIRDAKHLENIRQCCCVICGRETGIEAHHLLRTSEKAMGRRSGDNWAVPLCGPAWDNHHKGKDSPHDYGDETKWFKNHGFSAPNGRAPMSLAENFWRFRERPEFMKSFARTMAIFGQRRRAGRALGRDSTEG